MRLLSERLKIDTALIPTAALNGALTGPYYDMGYWGKALFVVEVGAMAAAATCAIQLMQAKDVDGTGSKALTGLTATIKANENVSVATLTLASVAVGDKVTINGVTFTAAAADLENRKFDQSGDNAADAASLAAAINHAAGVPGVSATSSNAVVTLQSTKPGEVTITITDPAATITPATVRAVGFVEVDASQLDANDGFAYVALRLTTSAALPVAATLLRGHGRYTPRQAVAAADVAL